MSNKNSLFAMSLHPDKFARGQFCPLQALKRRGLPLFDRFCSTNLQEFEIGIFICIIPYLLRHFGTGAFRKMAFTSQHPHLLYLKSR